MAELRIALTGASGTGKTTLASFIAETFNVPYNPVGSRSVAKAMGFDSPYDVDAAGLRAEFQRRLVIEKCAWENEAPVFVTDRTTLDNLAYTMLHDVKSIDSELLDAIIAGLSRYTHIIYCPVDTFCRPGDDKARLQDMTYHKLYDIVIKALVEKHLPSKTRFYTLHTEGVEDRRVWIERTLRTYLSFRSKSVPPDTVY